MKYLAHVPTEQYGFISIEIEGTALEAVAAYKELSAAFQGGQGVGMKALAQILHEYCVTGAIVNGGNHDFSTNEQLLLAEVRKLKRGRAINRVRPDQGRDKLDGD